uniref:Uncharacterized protein n=1 Tax=Anguilla anguilla TaxID=7936 RepID=A0A0E9VQ25_ANGAN
MPVLLVPRIMKIISCATRKGVFWSRTAVKGSNGSSWLVRPPYAYPRIRLTI